MTTTQRSSAPATSRLAATTLPVFGVLRVLAVLVRPARPAAHPVARPARSPWAGLRRTVSADAGMSTAEYAVGTVAAVAFAAVLYKVVQSGAVQSALSSIIQGALGITL